VTLLPPCFPCDLVPSRCCLVTPAVSGILGACARYAFRNETVLGYEIPGGATNVIDGRHE
jgi:hypothetical protein